MGSEEEDEYFLNKGAIGRLRILFFLNKVNDWVNKSVIINKSVISNTIVVHWKVTRS